MASSRVQARVIGTKKPEVLQLFGLSSDPPISNTPIGKWFQYPPWETLVYWIDERGGPQWRYFRGRGLLGTEGCPLLDWATPDWQRLEPRWHPVGPISFAARMQQIKGWRTVEFCSWVIPLVQKPDLVWNLIESNYAFRRPIHGGSRLKIEQLRSETDTFESTGKAAYSPLGCMAGHVWAVSCVLRCFESYRVVRAEALDFFRMIMTSSIQRRVLRDDWAGLVVFFTAPLIKERLFEELTLFAGPTSFRTTECVGTSRYWRSAWQCE